MAFGRRCEKNTCENPSSKNDRTSSISQERNQMKLSGNRASNAISKGCTLNLKKVYPNQDTARKLRWQINIVLSLNDDKPTYNIIVRRSFSELICKMAQNAIEEFNSTDI